MPVRRALHRRDLLVVTSSAGIELGTYDLRGGEVSEVEPAFREVFTTELDRWLAAEGLGRFPGFPARPADDRGADPPTARFRLGQRAADTLRFPRLRRSRRLAAGPPAIGPDAPTAAIEAGVGTPAGGWPGDPDDDLEGGSVGGGDHGRDEDGPDDGGEWEDLVTHSPDHGLFRAAARARATGDTAHDRVLRLRADGRHAVVDALRRELSTVSPGARRLGPRWRILHAVDLAVGDETVTIDHLVVGPPGVIVVDVRHQPGGKVHATARGLDVDGTHVDLARISAIAREVRDRLADALATGAGALEVLDPPAVAPAVVVVGATIVTHSRPRGVIVTRPGELPRAMRARGERLGPLQVAETFAVARRSDTWNP